MNAKEIRKALTNAGIPVWTCRTMTRSTGATRLVDGSYLPGIKFKRVELVIENSSDRDRAMALLSEQGVSLDRSNYSICNLGGSRIEVTL